MISPWDMKGVTKHAVNANVTSALQKLQPDMMQQQQKTRMKRCAGTYLLNEIPHSWILISCDIMIKVRLVCHRELHILQSSNSTSDSSISSANHSQHLYCLGNVKIMGNWCIIFFNQALAHPSCKSLQIAGKRGEEITGQHLCNLFTEVCNVSQIDMDFKEDVAFVDSVCILPLLDRRQPCPERSFTCSDLTCIPSGKRCNNVADCRNGEDEVSCSEITCSSSELVDCRVNCTWPSCTCSEGYFQCQTGGCVSADSVCDYEMNCADGSDEAANCHIILCPGNKRPCADHKMCLENERWFDGLYDCLDLSDEALDEDDDICPGYRCNNYTCIPSSQVNDGIPDCTDSQDEEDYMLSRAIARQSSSSSFCLDGFLLCSYLEKCYPRQKRCVYETDLKGNMKFCRNAGHISQCRSVECVNMFKCTSSYCLKFEKVCDGIKDCQDGSDEAMCPLTNCPGLFRCTKEDKCIHPEQVCDVTIDCKKSVDDEKYCHNKSVSSKSVELFHMSELSDLFHHCIVFLNRKGINNIVPSDKTPTTLVISLRLEQNAITKLPQFVFQGFPYLQYLYLKQNFISFIHPLAFKEIRKLVILDISYNRIRALSRQDFADLVRINLLDLSGNPLVHFDEIFFREIVVNGLFYSDAVICCMVPDGITCYISEAEPKQTCQRYLLLSQAFWYVVMLETCIIVIENVCSVVLILNNEKQRVILSLNLSDGMFAAYFLVLGLYHYFYGDHFSFYVVGWTFSLPCISSVGLFSFSMQVSSLTMILIICQMCCLIATPFKRDIHETFFKLVIAVWIETAAQFLLLTLLFYSYQGIIEAGNRFCYFPNLKYSLSFIVSVTLTIVHTLLLCCLILTGVVVFFLVSKSQKSEAKSSHSTRLKRRLLTNAMVFIFVNSISLSAVVTCVYCELNDMRLPDIVHLMLIMFLSPINKISNPWINVFVNILHKKIRNVCCRKGN